MEFTRQTYLLRGVQEDYRQYSIRLKLFLTEAYAYIDHLEYNSETERESDAVPELSFD